MNGWTDRWMNKWMDGLEKSKSAGRESNKHVSGLVQVRNDNGFN